MIESPETFLDRLGGLHDARVLALDFNVTERRLSVAIDDLNSNFDGLQDYAGKLPALLNFHGVEEIESSLQVGSKELNVFECQMVPSSSTLRIEFKFSPGGRLQIRFASMTCDTSA